MKVRLEKPGKNPASAQPAALRKKRSASLSQLTLLRVVRKNDPPLMEYGPVPLDSHCTKHGSDALKVLVQLFGG